ncbi:MAG: hypothetical protein JW941_09540 [Candidatus Coatesbacteria bacterium]|nr:hypothetical protein [Candidatus Coatesbacteria bacterium]
MRIVWLGLVFSVISLAICAYSAQVVQVQFGLSKELIYPPDRTELWAKISGLDSKEQYDLYIKVNTPTGKQVYVPGFTDKAAPALSAITLPPSSRKGWAKLFELELPSKEAPITEAGEYKAEVWLARKGESAPFGSSTTLNFLVVPCQRTSWGDDNHVTDVKCVGDEVFQGFPGGAAILPRDCSSRKIFKSEEGPGSTRTKLWKGPNGELLASGLDDRALFVREPYGWRMLRDYKGRPFPGLELVDLAFDGDGALWAKCMLGIGKPRLIRYMKDGLVRDYSEHILGNYYSLCTVSGKTMCVVTLQGIFVFNGSEFEFQEYPDDPFGARSWRFGSVEGLRMSAVLGEAEGNIWIAVEEAPAYPPSSSEFRFYAIAKHNIDTRKTVLLTTDSAPGLLIHNDVDQIISDPNGNIWFSGFGHVTKYDGKAFHTIDVRLGSFHRCQCIDAIPDGTVLGTVYAGLMQSYFGDMGGGFYVFSMGKWHNKDNPSPELPIKGSPSFIVGLPEGDALMTQGSTPVKLSKGKFQLLAPERGDINTYTYGVIPIQNELWAWGSSTLFRKSCPGWLAEEIKAKDSQFTRIIGILDDSRGNQLLLTEGRLLTKAKGAAGPGNWTATNSPAPKVKRQEHNGISVGYLGMRIDSKDRLYLLDREGIVIGSPGKDWRRIDKQNLLPGDPTTFAVSDSDFLYVAGGGEKGQYLCRIEDESTKTYWLDDLGFPVRRVCAIVPDMGDRMWLIAQTADSGLGRIAIYEPTSEALHDLPLSWAASPSSTGMNAAYDGLYADRSLAEYGVLWTGGHGGFPARLNLAPQTSILMEKERYAQGEKVQLRKWFKNYAGSVSADWYAAIEDASGNLLYYPSWSKNATPAGKNQTAHTDVMTVEDLPAASLPDDIAPGRYKWRTGFKKADQDEWLGLGFVESGEFEIAPAKEP